MSVSRKKEQERERVRGRKNRNKKYCKAKEKGERGKKQASKPKKSIRREKLK